MRDLKKSQQLFFRFKPSCGKTHKSISILYDYPDPFARFILDMANALPIFKELTDSEKTSISNRSTKMFTLSTIYQAKQHC